MLKVNAGMMKEIKFDASGGDFAKFVVPKEPRSFGEDVVTFTVHWTTLDKEARPCR